MEKRSVIIIGGDAAGMSAAAKAKRVNPNLEITVFEKGEYISYSQCGLPYYIGGVNPERGRLIARVPEDFEKQNISVLTRHEVTAIDVEKKKVTVYRQQTGERFEQHYDILVLATGAEPYVPPIPGKDLKNVMTLKTIPDADAIKAIAENPEIKHVVLVGGGYINVEMMEAMALLGKDVRLIQRPKTLLNKFDPEFGEIVQKEAEKHGVQVHTQETVEALIGEESVQKIRTDRGEYPADLVILAVGIRPCTKLLKNSGVEMLKNGAIIVDSQGRTNLPDIYAAGDCASVYHKVKERNVYIPLGTNANKQGRLVGAVIAGEDQKFQGVLGSAVVKVFDLTLAKTGISEEEAKEINLPYKSITVQAPSHAAAYPDPRKITIKLVYEKETKRLLGAQMAGEKGVAKRLDVFALAIDRKMTTEELGWVDFCYSPPYATPWDAVQIAANAAK